MVESINAGIPKLRIEESAAKKQASIDSGQTVIVGINQFINNEHTHPVQTRQIDNSKVRTQQLKKLKQLKENRSNNNVQNLLKQLAEACDQENQNLLQLSIEAMRQRATVGEVSEALAKKFGRYQATTQVVHNVYAATMTDNNTFQRAQQAVQSFLEQEGRRPRVLIAKIGQDGHDRGAKIVASGLADLGFDIDIGPLFQTPKEVAKQGSENDVHVIGLSSQAAGHKTLVPQLFNELKRIKRSSIHVIIGGIIPKEDYEFLYQTGIKAIFNPGSSIPNCALTIIDVILKSRSK